MAYKPYNTGFTKNTPNVELSEGVRPAQLYVAASFLPNLEYDAKMEDWKVLKHGKIVALFSKTTTPENLVVPAGLAIDIEKALSLVDPFHADNLDEYANVYTVIDVQNGIKNAAGQAVEAGEPVVKSFFTLNAQTGAITAQTGFVSHAIGVIAHDVWRQNGAGYGSDFGTGNPNNYNFTNYNLQHGITILTRYFVEVPIVDGVSTYPNVVLSMGQNGVKPGDVVTYDAYSNFAVATAPAIAAPDLDTPALAASEGDAGAAEILYASVGTLNTKLGDLVTDLEASLASIAMSIKEASARICGRVMFIDDRWPKDNMQYVRTWDPNTGNADLSTKAPGSATDGYPDFFTQTGTASAGVAKTAKINLLF